MADKDTIPFEELEAEIRDDPERRARVDRYEAELRAAMRLREIRLARGLSQTELAKRLGVTQKRVSAIERAEDMNLSTLARYVIALGGRLTAGAEFADETISLTPRR